MLTNTGKNVNFCYYGLFAVLLFYNNPQKNTTVFYSIIYSKKQFLLKKSFNKLFFIDLYV